jgi:uncharacterized protein
MLLEFRVKNFRCFRDEQVLDMGASTDDTLPGNVGEAGGNRAVRSAAIYGPNASGKSTLIAAVAAMRQCVVTSATIEPGTSLPIIPFLLDPATLEEPAEFSTRFIHEGTEYQYGFVADRKMVHREWLYAFPVGRRQVWFTRERVSKDKSEQKYAWDFPSNNLQGQKMRITQTTSPSALFLSEAARAGNTQLLGVYNWFRDKLRIMENIHDITTRYLSRDDEYGIDVDGLHEFTRDILRFADLAIDDFSLKEIDLDPEKLHFPESVSEGVRRELMKELQGRKHKQVFFSHQVEGLSEPKMFPRGAESDGTRRLFDMAGPLWETLHGNYTIFVDELETSLHPLLCRAIVELFHGPQPESSTAQLVFTTHNTSLLDRTLMRRDQIWFVEKDREQASHLYSLWDYKNVRKSEAFEKGYLTGRYGAIPMIDSLAPHE